MTVLAFFSGPKMRLNRSRSMRVYTVQYSYHVTNYMTSERDSGWVNLVLNHVLYQVLTLSSSRHLLYNASMSQSSSKSGLAPLFNSPLPRFSTSMQAVGQMGAIPMSVGGRVGPENTLFNNTIPRTSFIFRFFVLF